MYTHIYMYIHINIHIFVAYNTRPCHRPQPPVNLSSPIFARLLCEEPFNFFACMYVQYIYHVCTPNIYCVRTYINSIFARLFGKESFNSSCSSSSSCFSPSSLWAFGSRSFASQLRRDGSGRRTRGGGGRGARGGGVEQSLGGFLEVAVTHV